jgi:hypothetical protein
MGSTMAGRHGSSLGVKRVRAALLLASLVGLVACQPGATEQSPSVSQATSTAPSVAPAPHALLEPGTSVEIEARDVDGSWGTITLVRGEDVGGFQMVSSFDLDLAAADAREMFFQNDPDAFYVMLDVTYTADRIPDTYGAQDWLLTAPSGASATPIDRGGTAQDLVSDMPGSNFEVVESSSSTLVFPVPREAAQESLTLVYRTGGVAGAELQVREPGEPPGPVTTLVPPLPVPEGYVTKPDLPISVLFSPTADDLFSRPDTCTNPEAGYTVTYPDDWWTNTAIGEVPACSWFSPTFFEVDDPAVVPEEVVIVMNVASASAIGMSGQALPTPEIESIAGRPASRSEQVGVGGGFIPHGSHAYSYNVWIEGTCCDEAEPSIIAVASTDWQIQDDPATYILDKAILDRIMASLRFED